MASTLSSDVLVLSFKHLSAELDYKSLCNIGLTCRKWRSLSLPCLLERVDVSSHNNGRQPQFEDPEFCQVIHADYDGKFRQRNLVPRQRAFLRLLVKRPELSKHVQSFTWTLIWLDFDDEEGLLEIDLHTWEVFSGLTNVKTLDLGSLHDVWDQEYTRRSPRSLFSAVTDLRLLGWMHRGLIKAILGSLNLRTLKSLELDYLQDDGALLNGAPMSSRFAESYIRKSRRPIISFEQI
ncbi:hypothetical protein LTR95_010906, partial [Oleoguttula sp. CCFEE 5521]